MASTSSSSGDDDSIVGINVTPLVDVVLVLLVVFMVTAPVMYQSAIKVKLPDAKSGESTSGQTSPLTFTVTQEGSVLWNGKVMAWEEIEVRLKALGAKAAEQTVYLSADTSATHGNVIRLMDVLRQNGLTRFALSVEGRPSKH